MSKLGFYVLHLFKKKNNMHTRIENVNITVNRVIR